jgi:WD40 repeat protein
VRFWNLAARRPAGSLRTVNDSEHEVCVPHPAFSPDFKLLVYGRTLVRLADRRRVRLAVTASLDGDWYDELVFGPGGNCLYGRQSERIDRWELTGAFDDGVTVVRRKRPLELGARGLTVSPAGDRLAAADGRRVLFWRLPGHQTLPPVELPPAHHAIDRLTFSPDGRTLAVAADAVVHLLDVPTNTLRGAAALPARPADLCLTPDGGRLLSVIDGDTAVRVWDTADGSAGAVYDFDGHLDRLTAVSVAPDGLTAVAGGTDGRLVRWDL